MDGQYGPVGRPVWISIQAGFLHLWARGALGGGMPTRERLHVGAAVAFTMLVVLLRFLQAVRPWLQERPKLRLPTISQLALSPSGSRAFLGRPLPFLMTSDQPRGKCASIVFRFILVDAIPPCIPHFD
jgi:hypothetical protein